MRSYVIPMENYRDDGEFLALIDPVITHPVYGLLREYKHHHSSVYDHSIDVAWASFRAGRVLGLRLRELVRGALLHDFFLYDRRDRDQAIRFHFARHPAVSYRNAVKYFSPVTECERDIILRHMWPVATRLPKFRETYVVLVVDKLTALRELAEEAAQNLAVRREVA